MPIVYSEGRVRAILAARCRPVSRLRLPRLPLASRASSPSRSSPRASRTRTPRSRRPNRRSPRSRLTSTRRRAHELYQQGSYHEAIAELETALKLDPNGKDLVFNLGVVHEKLGDIEDALRYFQRYERMDLDAQERAKADTYLKRLQGARKEVEKPPEPIPVPVAVPPVQLPPEHYGRFDWLTASAAVIGVAGLAMGTVVRREGARRPPQAGRRRPTRTGTTRYESSEATAHREAVTADVCFIAGAAGVAGRGRTFLRSHAPFRVSEGRIGGLGATPASYSLVRHCAAAAPSSSRLGSDDSRFSPPALRPLARARRARVRRAGGHAGSGRVRSDRAERASATPSCTMTPYVDPGNGTCPAGMYCEGAGCKACESKDFCDGYDNDCDGIIDDGPYSDKDGDGFTNCGKVDPNNGRSSTSTADDDDAKIYPGADEICNGNDDNCDGIIDNPTGPYAVCPPGETCVPQTGLCISNTAACVTCAASPSTPGCCAAPNVCDPGTQAVRSPGDAGRGDDVLGQPRVHDRDLQRRRGARAERPRADRGSCTTPCCTSADCAIAARCARAQGRAGTTASRRPLRAQDARDGAARRDVRDRDASCRSGVCTASKCEDTCCTNTNCTNGTTCAVTTLAGNDDARVHRPPARPRRTHVQR